MNLNNFALRLPCSCNLKCRYCCGKIKPKEKPLTIYEIKDVIDQTAELGAKIFYIVGEGEPFLYPKIKTIIDYIDNKKMIPTIYSNCTLITKGLANYLYEKNARIIGKQNALSSEKQDKICRVDGAFNEMMMGLEYLIDVGFTDIEPSRLEIHTVTLKENLNDLPDLWRDWRNKNILPQVQALVFPSTDQDVEYFKYYKHHALSPVEARKLFEKLSIIDREEFNIKWDPILAYPIAPIGCCIHLNGGAVTQEGTIQICSYTEDSLGNIRENRLTEILESDKVKNIREIGKSFGYPGGKYGCRANALNMTGDRFAKDPFYDSFLKSGY